MFHNSCLSNDPWVTVKGHFFCRSFRLPSAVTSWSDTEYKLVKGRWRRGGVLRSTKKKKIVTKSFWLINRIIDEKPHNLLVNVIGVDSFGSHSKYRSVFRQIYKSVFFFFSFFFFLLFIELVFFFFFLTLILYDSFVRITLRMPMYRSCRDINLNS